ncbi:MAG: hypothetical protein AAFN91_13435, partial [Pseudomonadota bacterium]
MFHSHVCIAPILLVGPHIMASVKAPNRSFALFKLSSQGREPSVQAIALRLRPRPDEPKEGLFHDKISFRRVRPDDERRRRIRGSS